MAILIDFQKVREDAREVEYAFGATPELARRLVVDKQSRRARPVDGRDDAMFQAVVYRITVLLRGQPAWPERGTYAA